MTSRSRDITRQGSTHSNASSEKKKGFRRSLSTLSSSLKSFGTAPSSSASKRPEEAAQASSSTLSVSKASQASNQVDDSVKRDRRMSLNRLNSLRNWGSPANNNASSSSSAVDGRSGSSMPRSSSNLSMYRHNVEASLRKLRQKPAIQVGPIAEAENETKSTPKLSQKPQLTVHPSAERAIEAVDNAPTDEEVMDDPTTPRPNVPGFSLPPLEGGENGSPQRPSNAPRLSFGGDQIIDTNDWGELDKSQGSIRVTGEDDTLRPDTEAARRTSMLSEWSMATSSAGPPSSIGEIRQAEQVKPAPAQLVVVKNAPRQVSTLAPWSPNGHHDEVLQPEQLNGPSNTDSPPPKQQQSSIKRLISSDSWKKLSLSSTDMSPSKSKSSDLAAATEEGGDLADVAPASRPDELVDQKMDSLSPPSAREMSRSPTETSLTDNKGAASLTRSYSGHSLTNRLTTPGNRSSYGQARGSFESAGAGTFSRREGSVVDNLHRLSLSGTSPTTASTSSSPTTATSPVRAEQS